jgi:hypothetical protein
MTASMNIEDFLFPGDLRLSETPIRRVLVIGSCLAEEYVRGFRWHHPEVTFDHILFNNASDLPDAPPAPIASYDFLYLQIPLRSLLSDRIVRFGDFRGQLGADLAEAAMATLDRMLDTGLRYTRDHGLLTLISTLILPQRGGQPYLRRSAPSRQPEHADRRSERACAREGRRLRQRLYRGCRGTGVVLRQEPFPGRLVACLCPWRHYVSQL